jgi:hypothetical protein
MGDKSPIIAEFATRVINKIDTDFANEGKVPVSEPPVAMPPVSNELVAMPPVANELVAVSAEKNWFIAKCEANPDFAKEKLGTFYNYILNTIRDDSKSSLYGVIYDKMVRVTLMNFDTDTCKMARTVLNSLHVQYEEEITMTLITVPLGIKSWFVKQCLEDCNYASTHLGDLYTNVINHINLNYKLGCRINTANFIWETLIAYAAQQGPYRNQAITIVNKIVQMYTDRTADIEEKSVTEEKKLDIYNWYLLNCSKNNNFAKEMFGEAYDPILTLLICDYQAGRINLSLDGHMWRVLLTQSQTNSNSEVCKLAKVAYNNIVDLYNKETAAPTEMDVVPIVAEAPAPAPVEVSHDFVEIEEPIIATAHTFGHLNIDDLHYST